MMYNDYNFAQQGWECPKCGAVYSPSTPMCFNCTGKTDSNNSKVSDNSGTGNKPLVPNYTTGDSDV